MGSTTALDWNCMTTDVSQTDNEAHPIHRSGPLGWTSFFPAYEDGSAVHRSTADLFSVLRSEQFDRPLTIVVAYASGLGDTDGELLARPPIRTDSGLGNDRVLLFDVAKHDPAPKSKNPKVLHFDVRSKEDLQYLSRSVIDVLVLPCAHADEVTILEQATHSSLFLLGRSTPELRRETILPKVPFDAPTFIDSANGPMGTAEHWTPAFARGEGREQRLISICKEAEKCPVVAKECGKNCAGAMSISALRDYELVERYRAFDSAND